MNRLVSALREVPYFQDLPAAAIEGLARRARLREVTASEPILIHGQECAGLGVVVAGQVRVSRNSPEGREQVLRILGPGRTFNDAAAIDGKPNPGTVTAAEDSVVVLIPRQALLRLIDEYPGVSAAMLHVLAYRLRSLVDLTEDSALHSVVARVARLLLRCYEGDQPLVEGVPDACVRITQ
ncbi:MAG TPA: Crp/Fnr family transcriptional regulator, partial [Gammaproteobacteria bacterium]|nr:Crp/Fnr family transcriptional regulator [Gammaproteobacteria bacterium]